MDEKHAGASYAMEAKIRGSGNVSCNGGFDMDGKDSVLRTGAAETESSKRNCATMRSKSTASVFKR